MARRSKIPAPAGCALARAFRRMVSRLGPRLSRRETGRPLHPGTAPLRSRRRHAAAADHPAPNDHTSGTTRGKPTPTAQVADNDLALGRVVEAVSHSKFWPQTAIFVIEDDAQNGPDHVDAHRSIAFVISPYVERGTVDSTMYSTSSMLRTMELILGLKPMSQFDAAAVPMFRSFQTQPDLRPYQALPANVNLDEKNVKTAWGSQQSKKMDFSKEDAADDLLLNEVIWRSVRGRDHPMPAPVRAALSFRIRKTRTMIDGLAAMAYQRLCRVGNRSDNPQ